MNLLPSHFSSICDLISVRLVGFIFVVVRIMLFAVFVTTKNTKFQQKMQNSSAQLETKFAVIKTIFMSRDCSEDSCY